MHSCGLIAWLIDGQLYCPDCCHPTQGEIDHAYACARFVDDSEHDLSACCGTCHHTIACCARIGIVAGADPDCFECERNGSPGEKP